MGDQRNSEIQQLQKELLEREKDIETYRNELLKAHSKIQTLIDHLREDVSGLRAVQQALVPTELPHIPGFELSSKFVPSSVQGGDYFDVLEQSDRFQFGAFLASCETYAGSSLLLSILMKQAQVDRGTSSEDFLSWVEAEFKKAKVSFEGLGMAYVLVDRRRFQLSYSSRGDLPVLIQRAETGVVTSLNSGTLNFDLQPKDRILLASRGVLEARNPEGEVFGLARLSQALRQAPSKGVHEIRNHIFLELQNFQKNDEVQRDQTVFALQIKDRLIKLAPNKP